MSKRRKRACTASSSAENTSGAPLTHIILPYRDGSLGKAACPGVRLEPSDAEIFPKCHEVVRDLSLDIKESKSNPWRPKNAGKESKHEQTRPLGFASMSKKAHDTFSV